MGKVIFYVSHVGHRWAMMAVDCKTLEEAERDALASCGDAMLTRIHRVDLGKPSESVLIATYARDGRKVEA